MANFSNNYGNKTNGSSLEATEWNQLMTDLDNSFLDNSEEAETTPVTTSDLNDQPLLSRIPDNLNQTLSPGTTIGASGVNSPRGAIARLGLTDANINSTKETDLATVTYNPGTKELTEKVFGDRIRFGSWYIATVGQTEFGCTHEFLEIVNSGSIDVDMSHIKLGMITSKGTTTINLTGGIKARSTYLIRGKKVGNEDSIIQLNNNCDIDISGTLLWKGIKFSDVWAFVLFWEGMTFDDNVLIAASLNDVCTAVNPYLVDFIISDEAYIDNLKTSNGTRIFAENPAYTLVSNAINKDLYSLDPAKQAYRSLTTCKTEASNVRSQRVQHEAIPLGNKVVSFPHSKPTQPVTKYTPKASGLNKNILTDKTSPDFKKPNMVTCSHGIDAATTRCFNWFSMSRTDEYVWIRKQGERTWNKFESYKSTDGTSTVQTDSSTIMHRKEFHKDIVKAVYARIDNVFPGDSTYTYRAHKCVVYIQSAITAGNEPIVYEYTVGKADSNGKPNKEATSDIYTFTLYPSDWTPKVYHTSDQQGFSWMEYLMWAAAAEEINDKILEECNESTKLFPIVINTGDMTLNGTRVNEWIDYYNAGLSIFSHVEQMNVIGNNDLCNSYSEKALGIGSDYGKSSPYYFYVFYCYEIPNDVTTTTGTAWTGPLIYNDKYIPSMYYFHFGKYYYLMVNSEVSATMDNIYYNAKNDENIINLYTGYEQKGPKQYSCKNGYLGKTLETWIDTIPSGSITIAACHEMPFTVTTKANLVTNSAILTDRSIDLSAAKSLVGSHLNTLGNTWTNDNNYWFSKLLQNKGIKLCIGGHKHTYAVTYPIADIYQKEGNTNDYFIKDDTKVTNSAILNRIEALKTAGATGLSKLSIIKTTALLNNANDCNTLFWNADSTLTCGVVYFMLQATGYKQTSNKELPSKYQTYSKIVPDTVWSSNTEGTADESQKYPMYGTYEYGNGVINACIFRVVNITTETIDSSATMRTYMINTFSETVNSDRTMYSEKLLYIPKYNGTNTNSYPNFWFVPEKYKSVCYSFDNNELQTIQRCYLDGTDLKGYIKIDDTITLCTLNKESDYTMQISL